MVGIRRGELIALFGGVAVSWPLAARAVSHPDSRNLVCRKPVPTWFQVSGRDWENSGLSRVATSLSKSRRHNGGDHGGTGALCRSGRADLQSRRTDPGGRDGAIYKPSIEAQSAI
jgi:hypothetical protein